MATTKIMANKIYVIVFVAILSNAQLISQNKNNRYDDDRHGVMLATAVAANIDTAAVANSANHAMIATTGMGLSASVSASSIALDETMPHRLDTNHSGHPAPTEFALPSLSSSMPSIMNHGFMNENASRDQSNLSIYMYFCIIILYYELRVNKYDNNSNIVTSLSRCFCIICTSIHNSPLFVCMYLYTY